jgi:signal recognition particle receptor subunit beta
MVQFNFSERTIKAKVVYYGPPQSGKTTNLEQIHKLTDPEGSNRLISLNTAQDRTLFFDLLPFSLGTVSGYDFKIQLYTVPGQVQYNATRRVVLAGADAVVFVADSHKPMARENVAAFENMKVNLLANRLVPEKVPLVFQYNKQDLEALTPRAELDRTLNTWGRKAFPAVASRGEGVLETFVAVVQDMLAAIALKYNLKEKGLDPNSVPEVVAQAFAEIVRKVAAPLPATAPPPRVVISQPEGAEPAYPGQVGPEASPVSEELLHRAIRSNIELAEALGQVVRDVGQGLGRIRARARMIAAGSGDTVGAAAEIEREVRRLDLLLKDLGQSAAGRAVASARPAASSAVAAAAVASLDGLVSEVLAAVHPTLAGRPLGVESHIARGAALPRCSPAALRRALAALLQGLAGGVTPSSTILMRAEKKPVLLRGRDGREMKRDFLMIALTHAGGPSELEQQRVLQGSEASPIGDAQRLVREMGGFMRFAPLPGGALETRVFIPA